MEEAQIPNRVVCMSENKKLVLWCLLGAYWGAVIAATIVFVVTGKL